MKIELLDDVVYRNEVWRAGDTIEVPDKDAERLCDEGKAKPARVVIEVHDFTQEFSCA